jgi:SpoVK/Ycf46/Vps4 family AAA+-type ATPase
MKRNNNDLLDDDDDDEFDGYSITSLKHRNISPNNSDDDYDFLYSLTNYQINEKDKELINIDRKVETLDDLIELGKMYNPTKRYNIDLKTLNKLVNPLTELNNMIGMNTIKQEIIDHIIFKLQDLDDNQDMMHTVIQGPPGVGKTEVAKIIGKIYLAMGILKNNNFIKVKRSDLIAGYLGQTAKLTQSQINKAFGGVLFIDEVYSLGNAELRDSYSKECIDTINENLTENKNKFICIIAGYTEEIKSCFFAYNPGLERRFSIRFTIDTYNANEIYQIFKKKVYENKWMLDDTINVHFFEKNYEHFKYFGGDMETLFNKCKRTHSRRIFTSNNIKKMLNIKDLENGFKIFISHTNHKKTEIMNEAWKSMYI